MLGEAPPSLDAGTGDAHVPPLEVRAQLGGICLARMIVRDNTQDCPDPAQFEACVKDNCNLAECISECASYVACLETSADVCDLTCSQLLDKPCSDCTGSLRTCALGFCGNQFSCASPPAPDGPCAKLEACCGMQGDSAASCLDTVHAIERLSGDPSCYGIMRDWGATPHFPVPCDFEK
jgi:hypothetical protein